jgi:hypothetical protein
VTQGTTVYKTRFAGRGACRVRSAELLHALEAAANNYRTSRTAGDVAGQQCAAMARELTVLAALVRHGGAIRSAGARRRCRRARRRGRAGLAPRVIGAWPRGEPGAAARSRWISRSCRTGPR